MFSPPSLFVCLSVNSLKKELAEAGRQTVLGPEISRLDFTDDPDLGFPPSGTIMSLKDLCVPLGMLVQYSACPNQQLNNISPYVCVREGSCSCECTVHHFKRVRADSEVRRLSTDVCVSLSPTLTSSRTSLLRVRSSGRSLISCSILCRPPCCTMDLDFSAMDCGIESPDRSSSAAGRFRDANTLMKSDTAKITVF